MNQSWGYLLSKIAQDMAESFTKELAHYEISSRDYGILSAIYNNENLTQKGIGFELQIDRTTMVQLIDNLESKNLLKRVSNPADRRANLIRITEKGRAILEERWEALERCEKDVIHQMTVHQKKAIKDIYHYLQKEELEND
ncbi:MarR family transcriptional regulator [Virgibacillus sp. NKC19-3]|uniref:MarR family winged helix-turn-helix transcriptional regulator n=1 Tax=Virgibacillus saliphilus TaxID=2831674 RepID=UPI001C9AA2E9|nr:MarR family transcriptional regulator [Virgibacillus sp. NKC19-3]MBY7141965.1 MarR family transcriptional regulator [Virgibacillus sp. NKC19-3]